MTSTRPSADPDAAAGARTGPRRLDLSTRATVVGTVAGVLSLGVAVAAWQWPRSPGPEPQASATAPEPTTGPQHVPPTGGPTGGGTPAPVEYLAGTAPESGAAHLVPLPRAVRADAAYARRALVIGCPSNETGDQERSVTFALRGRYARFDAQVHPYYPPGADARSVTFVTVFAGVRDRDATLTTAEAGAQKRAAPGSPLPVAADVEGAETVTLRVQCDDPGGVVALTDARVTPA
ncbi:hypothetical protein [Spirilliplanes yamanashiensis]|uniref:Uncharacterized protein n=1 Tax=Spirilliplanes yamanashiensis TaxID=42233 RepID=A0A8J3Y9X1_9ACTN|nr:hypothetical protein [Spirilliplanes yamanashiensis]MDP9815803.1 hypothetical protein [Spirilliplanes yamanashiensis]GIJ04057.1 hypothetical protein Sya03_34090 [Spirilliplanes yamanashiensis]